MAAQLKQQLGLESDLVVGNPGEFTVWLDGAKVSEKVAGQFPEPPEVIAAIRARQQA